MRLYVKATMQKEIQQSIIIGLVATIVMTLVIIIGGAMGMPKMSSPAILAGMMGTSIAIGWSMHFLIGIIFAVVYVFLFNKWLEKITTLVLRGALYGSKLSFLLRLLYI